MNRGFYWRKNH